MPLTTNCKGTDTATPVPKQHVMKANGDMEVQIHTLQTYTEVSGQIRTPNI
jgi:hypothetical protein